MCVSTSSFILVLTGCNVGIAGLGGVQTDAVVAELRFKLGESEALPSGSHDVRHWAEKLVAGEFKAPAVRNEPDAHKRVEKNSLSVSLELAELTNRKLLTFVGL